MPIERPEGMFDIWGWLVSTLGVIVSPLGTFLWKDEDFRFLFGPELPALFGEPGRERLVGVMVPEVVCETYPWLGSWCTWLCGLYWPYASAWRLPVDREEEKFCCTCPDMSTMEKEVGNP